MITKSIQNVWDKVFVETKFIQQNKIYNYFYGVRFSFHMYVDWVRVWVDPWLINLLVLTKLEIIIMNIFFHSSQSIFLFTFSIQFHVTTFCSLLAPLNKVTKLHVTLKIWKDLSLLSFEHNSWVIFFPFKIKLLAIFSFYIVGAGFQSSTSRVNSLKMTLSGDRNMAWGCWRLITTCES